MAKSILYRLFGVGKKPKNQTSLLESEGIILEDEGLKGSITFREYRAPGKYFLWKRVWFIGSIVLTQNRLTAYAYSKTLLNVPLQDSRIKKLNLSVEKNEKLLIAFSASEFNPEQSGQIEYRFNTPLAEKLIESLREKIS